MTQIHLDFNFLECHFLVLRIALLSFHHAFPQFTVISGSVPAHLDLRPQKQSHQIQLLNPFGWETLLVTYPTYAQILLITSTILHHYCYTSLFMKHLNNLYPICQYSDCHFVLNQWHFLVKSIRIHRKASSGRQVDPVPTGILASSICTYWANYCFTIEPQTFLRAQLSPLWIDIGTFLSQSPMGCSIKSKH